MWQHLLWTLIWRQKAGKLFLIRVNDSMANIIWKGWFSYYSIKILLQPFSEKWTATFRYFKHFVLVTSYILALFLGFWYEIALIIASKYPAVSVYRWIYFTLENNWLSLNCRNLNKISRSLVISSGPSLSEWIVFILWANENI